MLDQASLDWIAELNRGLRASILLLFPLASATSTLLMNASTSSRVGSPAPPVPSIASVIAELLAACFAVSADEYADFVRFARSRQPCISPYDAAPWRTFRRQVLNLPAPPAPLLTNFPCWSFASENGPLREASTTFRQTYMGPPVAGAVGQGNSGEYIKQDGIGPVTDRMH